MKTSTTNAMPRNQARPCAERRMRMPASRAPKTAGTSEKMMTGTTVIGLPAGEMTERSHAPATLARR